MLYSRYAALRLSGRKRESLYPLIKFCANFNMAALKNFVEMRSLCKLGVLIR